MTTFQKAIAALVVIPALLFAGLFGYVLYKGPRMTVQHHIREYQMIMPERAAGSVTVATPFRLPGAAEAGNLKNPLQPDAGNLAAARVYYQYYCVFCHGDSGAGNGPVGNSYTPRPADLRSKQIAGYSDGQLLRAMLTGLGHEPVLERVVPPGHRWHLALFVRSLQQVR
jgi:cytochrome c553